MQSARTLKWVTGALEAFLAIPVLGGVVVMGFYYIPLLIMLILHIITLVLSVSNKETKYGSVVGVVTSLVAWIPFVGWFMHVASAIVLMISAATTKRAQPAAAVQPPYPGTF